MCYVSDYEFRYVLNYRWCVCDRVFNSMQDNKLLIRIVQQQYMVWICDYVYAITSVFGRICTPTSFGLSSPLWDLCDTWRRRRFDLFDVLFVESGEAGIPFDLDLMASFLPEDIIH